MTIGKKKIRKLIWGTTAVIGAALFGLSIVAAKKKSDRKHDVNEIKLGLPGWVIINGCDEIEIPEKVRLDGEYVKNESLLLDAKFFLGAMTKVEHDDSVVEGVTDR